MSEGVSSIGSCIAVSASVPPSSAITQEGFEANTIEYIDSGEAIQLGDLGPESEVITFNTMCDGKVNKRMGATNFGQQTTEFAFDSGNDAQKILMGAAKSKKPISIKETLSSGDIYYYIAYVSQAKTMIGGSSDYLRLSVNLEIDSEIVEVAAAVDPDAAPDPGT